MSKKMASVAMLIGGALANTLAFIGSSYLFHRLSKDSIDTERKRHHVVIEQLQKAQIEWANARQQRINSSIINSGQSDKNWNQIHRIE